MNWRATMSCSHHTPLTDTPTHFNTHTRSRIIDTYELCKREMHSINTQLKRVEIRHTHATRTLLIRHEIKQQIAPRNTRTHAPRSSICLETLARTRVASRAFESSRAQTERSTWHSNTHAHTRHTCIRSDTNDTHTPLSTSLTMK